MLEEVTADKTENEQRLRTAPGSAAGCVTRCVKVRQMCIKVRRWRSRR
jgi:hypothetical protein